MTHLSQWIIYYFLWMIGLNKVYYQNMLDWITYWKKKFSDKKHSKHIDKHHNGINSSLNTEILREQLINKIRKEVPDPMMIFVSEEDYNTSHNSISHSCIVIKNVNTNYHIQIRNNNQVNKTNSTKHVFDWYNEGHPKIYLLTESKPKEPGKYNKEDGYDCTPMYDMCPTLIWDDYDMKELIQDLKNNMYLNQDTKIFISPAVFGTFCSFMNFDFIYYLVRQFAKKYKNRIFTFSSDNWSVEAFRKRMSYKEVHPKERLMYQFLLKHMEDYKYTIDNVNRDSSQLNIIKPIVQFINISKKDKCVLWDGCSTTPTHFYEGSHIYKIPVAGQLKESRMYRFDYVKMNWIQQKWFLLKYNFWIGIYLIYWIYFI